MESEVWLACVIFVKRHCIFIGLRSSVSMKFMFLFRKHRFLRFGILCTLFFTLESFLKHKLVEISAWSSENNASSSNTLKSL